MDSSEKISLTFTSKEYSSLLNIDNCSDEVEMTIMNRNILKNGHCVITGSQEELEELANTISEELNYVSKKSERTLLMNALVKFDSVCDDIDDY